jgi:hypothetical protein
MVNWLFSFAERAEINTIGAMIPRDDYRKLHCREMLATTAFRPQLSSRHLND